MSRNDEPPPGQTPVLTAKLAQLLHDHPDFYAQIFPPKGKSNDTNDSQGR